MILFLLFMNPLQDFKVAEGLFKDGMYEIAEKELKLFITKYKEHEYAKNAVILYLKSLYAQNKYVDVIEESKIFFLEYPEVKDEIAMIKGKSEAKLGRFNEAERTFNQIQDKKKRYSFIGDIYYDRKDYKNAILYYQKIGDDYGNISIGWCYYKMGRLEDALKYFKIVKDKRYTEEAVYMSGKIQLYINGKNEELVKYLKDYPNGKFKSNVLITLGEYYEEKDFKASKNYYMRIVNEKLEHYDYALYRIGIVHFKKELYDSSLYYFNLVEPTSRYFGDCLYYIARINSIKGNNEIALNLYRQIIKDYKELKDKCYFRIAEIYRIKGELNKAIENFKKIEGELKIGAHIELGNIFLSKGEFDSALLYFSFSDDEKMIFLKAITYFKMGKYEDAIRDCERLLKISKDKELLLKVKLLLGDTYLEKKDFRKSIQFYEDVLKEDFRNLNASALEGLGWAYFGEKDYRSAFNYLDRLSKEYPDYQAKGKVFLTMGDIAYSMKDYNRAIEYYGKVKGESEPEAIYKKGLVLFDKGDFKDAINVFNELRKKFPLYERSDEALFLVALSFRKLNDLYSSSVNARELLKLSISKELRAKTTILLADNFFDQGRFDSSIYYYERYTYIFTKPQKELIPGIRGIAYSVYKLKGEREFENIVDGYLKKYKETDIIDDLSIIFAKLYLIIGNPKRSIEILQNINTTDAKLALLDVYRMSKDEEKFIKLLNELMKEEKTREKALFELANFYFTKKDFSKSKEYSKNLNNEEGNYIYILSLVETDNTDEALIEIERRKLGVYYDLLKGIILIRRDEESGLNFLENAMKIDKTAPYALFEKAKYLIRKGKNEEAKDILFKIRYLYQESEIFSPSMIMLSKILIKEGKKQEAKKILENVIERKDGYEKEAKSLIDGIR